MRQASNDNLADAVEAAERWAMFDPDPVTRGRLDRLVDAAAPELLELFTGRVTFGTAGLRAPVGVGPNRMNAVVVRQTTVGVMQWLAEQQVTTTPPTVVIGFDARPDSAAFARHVAAAVAAAGGDARLADRVTPTPVVAHRLLAQRASAAVVITASHNPPGDNGYKLYAHDGMQIVAPAEHEIAAKIGEVAQGWAAWAPLVDDAWAAGIKACDAGDWIDAHRADAVAHLDSSCRSAAPRVESEERASVRVVYTALHGVGGQATLDAFAAAGFPAPIVVDSQFEPDGSFPTVTFPNPEEPGALDEAMRVAGEHEADLVVAHDPDADRLAVAARTEHGDLALLTGDQLGALLGDHLLARYGDDAPRALVARSVVSGRLLDRIAAHYGATCAVTLTGFKWIARAGVEHPDRDWCFGYEEAIGYCVGSHVRDKDGITAALVAVDLAQALAARSATLWSRLGELDAQHGVHRSRPVTLRFDDDPGQVDAVVAALVDQPPRELGGSTVTAALAIGGGALPPTPGLEMHLDDASRVIVRPSGTEPKVKAYLDVIVEVDGPLEVAQATASSRLDALAASVEELFSR